MFSRGTQIHSPVHLVIRYDGNDGGNADAVRQAVPEQRPTGESPCLMTETKTAVLQLVLYTTFLPLWPSKMPLCVAEVG